MSDLQIFSNAEFGNVRVVDINGVVWFVAADVCRVLELTNITETLRRLDTDELTSVKLNSGGQMREMNIINESGLYALVIRSRKPFAKRFRKWLTSEVVPSIRKHGAYMTPAKIEEILSDPDTIIQLATQLKIEREQNAVLKTQIAELQPKASYYDLILQCPDLVSTSVIAKDYGFSAKSFNRLLHRLGVQFKQGDIWLLYQKYASRGWTSTKTHNFPDRDGNQHCRPHTYWTQKGRIELYNLLKRKGYLPTIEGGNANG